MNFHPSPPRAPHLCPSVSGPNTVYPRALVLGRPPTAYFPALRPHPRAHGTPTSHTDVRGRPTTCPKLPLWSHTGETVSRMQYGVQAVCYMYDRTCSANSGADRLDVCKRHWERDTGCAAEDRLQWHTPAVATAALPSHAAS